jgi:hypothetical protein
MKEVACIPYAIADRYDVQGWQEPLIITNGSGKRFYVRIQIDKLEQTIHSEVKEALDYNTEEEKQNKTKQVQNYTGRYTEVEVCIPEIKTLDILNNQLHVLFLRFALLNTHVAFHFEFPALKKEEDGSDANTTTVISLPVPAALAVATDQHLQKPYTGFQLLIVEIGLTVAIMIIIILTVN